MPHENQKGADYQIDPKAPDNVHETHAAGTDESGNSVGKQPSVPKGSPGDPTRETWEKISGDKVMTTKEEMPSPQKPK